MLEKERARGVEARDHYIAPRFLVISLLEDLAQLCGGLLDSGQATPRETALHILRDRLGLSGVGLFSAENPTRLASAGIPSEAETLLVRDGANGLLARASTEKRIFLLGRGSIEPCMVGFRELGLDCQVLALVPLMVGADVSSVLVLIARDGTMLSPGLLDTLHPVFRFLAISLAVSGASKGGAPVSGAMPGLEELEVELEALRARNLEVEDLLREAGEAAAAVEAAKRLATENARFRIAELESSLAGAGAPFADSPCDTCIALQQTEHQSVIRIHALEEELAEWRLGEELEISGMDLALATEVDGDGVLPRIVIEDAPTEAVALEVMAEAAVAELVGRETVEAGEIGESPPATEHQENPATLAVLEKSLVPDLRSEPPEVDGSAGPWVLYCAEGSHALLAELTDFSREQGMPICSPGDTEILPGRKLVLVNLLADDPGKLIAGLEAAGEDFRLLAYFAHAGCGAALGEIGWFSPALATTAAALTQLRTKGVVPGRTLLVSERLRAMAPLREALTNEGSSVAMACDTRQALDLLEIVQKPDVVILDLAKEGAAVLALGARLRQENAGTGLQIFLWESENHSPQALQADLAWEEASRPFGVADLQRLIAPWARPA